MCPATKRPLATTRERGTCQHTTRERERERAVRGSFHAVALLIHPSLVVRLMQSASSHTHRRDSAVSQLVDNVMMLCANAALGHECPTLHKSSFTLALSFCFLFRDPHFLLFVVTCCSCCTFLHAMNAMVGLIFSYFRSLSCFSFTLCSLFICTGKQKQSSTSFLLHFFFLLTRCTASHCSAAALFSSPSSSG